MRKIEFNELNLKENYIIVYPESYFIKNLSKGYNHSFLIAKEFTEANWMAKVKDSVTYIYNIKTKGDMVQDSSSVAKREIIVKWRSEYLSIDRYNEYYLTAIKTTGNFYTETDSSNILWSCLKIEVLPYTNLNIAFYRTENFNKNLNENGAINSKEEFINLVKTELVTE